jgi:ribA/ribD-fused uncharacterized protein
MIKTPEEYGYVVKNNVCLFQKGPLSQWWGGYKNQEGGFVTHKTDLFYLHCGDSNPTLRAIQDHYFESIYFNCAEQWMMACKAALFKDTKSFFSIMDTRDPKEQHRLGRSIQNFQVESWDYFKYQIVARGTEKKFDSNPELKEFLMYFHPFTIFAEAAPWDKVWGIGLGPDNEDSLDINKWQGSNLLGRALTVLRHAYEDQSN